MNKVTTINLNGRSYQVEEAGYDALRKYLDQAAAKLKDDPDKAEIMADFEQAIADKCDAHLAPRKNVVTTAEIEAIIATMGPVDAGSHTGAEKQGAEAATGNANAPKRLYRIHEGSMFRGVCTGLAAYFNIDVTLVRALFVIFTVLTGGGWIIAYLVLMLVMPVARNADEVAQAHGEPPFTAQDFIDRAKAEYKKFADDPTVSKAEWHAKAREWKQEMRAKRRAWQNEWRAERDARHADEWRRHGGFPALIGGIISAALWILFIVVAWSFLVTGLVFGHAFGIGHPIWVTLLFLALVFWLISLPFRAMIWSSHWGNRGYCGHRHGGGIGSLLFLIFLFYVASLLFPPVHNAWEHVIAYLQTVR